MIYAVTSSGVAALSHGEHPHSAIQQVFTFIYVKYSNIHVVTLDGTTPHLKFHTC